jgi:aminoglycoside phosphotransferase (APT) family kinase protein
MISPSDHDGPASGPEGLGDLARLADHVAAELGPGFFAGLPRAELVEGGKSNLTYHVTDGTQSWALRRPPLGHVLPTAHDMSREFRLISALAPTTVPVPQPVLLITDPDVLGSTFYLMEWVDGTVYRTAGQTADLAPARAAALVESMLDVLADVHSLDPASVGLGDFGRPVGFLDRQLRRWLAQLDASRSRPLPGIDELHATLSRTLPESPAPAILHGDYRLDNLIIGADDSIAAVVDWEMTTVGDPLTDVGLLLVYWDGLSGLPGSVSEAVGPASPFPRGDALIDGYSRRTGADLATLPWYVAFGYFKLAVINEGIYYRHAHGQTVGAGFEHMGDHTAALVQLGHRTLRAGALPARPSREEN